jgi:hypothetical protein
VGHSDDQLAILVNEVVGAGAVETDCPEELCRNILAIWRLDKSAPASRVAFIALTHRQKTFGRFVGLRPEPLALAIGRALGDAEE